MKPRKPRPVYLNALQRAIESSAKLQAKDREALKEITRDALDDFKRGQSCSANWRSCADALNIAEALASNICSDDASRAKIAAGLDVLGAVAARHHDRATWSLYPTEMQVLDEALFIHRVQLDFCSLGEYDRAVKRVADRTRAALAGSVGPGVQVVMA